MVFYLRQLCNQFPAQDTVSAPADQPRRRDGSLDFMNPALDIFPILFLGGPGIRDRLNHVLARPAHQPKERPLPDGLRPGEAFREQVLLIQPLHDGFQLQEPPPAFQEVDGLHRQKENGPHKPQDRQDAGLGARKGQKEDGTRPGRKKQDQPPQPVPQKFAQCHIRTSPGNLHSVHT